MTGKRARDRRRVLNAVVSCGKAYVEAKHIADEVPGGMSGRYAGLLLAELAEHGSLEVEKDNNTRTLYRVPEELRG